MPGDRGKLNEPNDITKTHLCAPPLYIHMPMYYHVCEASPNLADPYDAAEDYLSKKGPDAGAAYVIFGAPVQ